MTPSFPAVNFFGNPVNVFPKTGTFNMICLPRERAQSVPGLHEITDPHEQLGPRRS